MPDAAFEFRSDTIAERSPEVAYEVLDGEGVLFHEGTGQLYVFNPTATMIWEALDGRYTIEEIVAEFERLTGAPRATIESDVLSALREFSAAALLDVAPTRSDA